MRKFIFAFFALFISTTALYADDLGCREIIGKPTQQQCKTTYTYRCYWDSSNNRCQECGLNQYPNSKRTGCESRSTVCHQYNTQESCNNKKYCKWHSNDTDYKCDAAPDGAYYPWAQLTSVYCENPQQSVPQDTIYLNLEDKHVNPPEDSIFTYMYDGMTHMCQWKAKCPAGTKYTVSVDKTSSYFAHSCATCGDKEYSTGEEIKFYDNGYINTNTNDYTGCKQCPKGLESNTTHTGCICTNKQQYFNTNDNACQDCPQGFIANENGDGCITAPICNYGEYFNTQSWECQECQGNTFQPDTTKTPLQCWPCPENSFVDDDHVFCTCDAGYFTNEAYNNKKIDYEGYVTEVFKYIGFKYIERDIPIPEKCEQSIAIINQEEFNTYHNEEYGEYNNCHSGGYYWSGPKTLLPGDDYYDSQEPGADNGTIPYCDTKCEAGYYCTAIPSEQTTISKEENKHKCPDGYTSDLGSDELTDCYMKPNTQFCDKDNNCQTLAQIFGDGVKIYYHD